MNESGQDNDKTLLIKNELEKELLLEIQIIILKKQNIFS